jgi:hypothetical protein
MWVLLAATAWSLVTIQLQARIAHLDTWRTVPSISGISAASRRQSTQPAQTAGLPGAATSDWPVNDSLTWTVAGKLPSQAAPQ